ncbi:hypothetical protein MMC11_002539 [Xylographa trunciseda]|nr:hypothetical protein [Xylographa soralifera]MCJ1399337.1 hypothetical protein [Xylographa trunciseda]
MKLTGLLSLALVVLPLATSAPVPGIADLSVRNALPEDETCCLYIYKKYSRKLSDAVAKITG